MSHIYPNTFSDQKVVLRIVCIGVFQECLIHGMNSSLLSCCFHNQRSQQHKHDVATLCYFLLAIAQDSTDGLWKAVNNWFQHEQIMNWRLIVIEHSK